MQVCLQGNFTLCGAVKIKTGVQAFSPCMPLFKIYIIFGIPLCCT